MSDLRYALRQLLRSPGFSLTIVLTVALGVGGTTAMFTVVRAVLLKPLAYHDPNNLVVIEQGATPMRYEEFTAANRAFAALGAFAGGQAQVALTGRGEPEVLKASRVSANFLDVLGARPHLGRGFFPSEDAVGGPNAVLLSAELWERRFASDPAIVGKSLMLDGSEYSVVGVLPARFQFPLARTDLWITHPDEWLAIPAHSRRISPTLRLFARLKPGVDLAAATAEVQVLQGQYCAAHPGTLDAKTDPPQHLQRLKDELVSGISTKLWMLLGAVALVLLLVCSNVASLLLVRASARAHEFAVRAAIGAGRARLISLFLMESLCLSLLGAAGGVALAAWSLTLLKRLPSLDLPRSAEIHLDLPILGFAIAVSFLAGTLFELLPSLTASRVDLNRVLRASGEGTAFASTRPRYLRISGRSLLISGQVAISVVLLIGAVLLIESLANVYRVDPGFQSSQLLTMSLSLSPVRYDTDAKRAAFYQLPFIKGSLTRCSRSLA
jgi:predicted permease